MAPVRDQIQLFLKEKKKNKTDRQLPSSILIKYVTQFA